MSFWSKAFRFTAIFLVLFVAVQVIACDLLPSSDCFISHSQDKHQGQSSGDNCLCCCAHVMVVKNTIIIPQETIAPAPSEEVLEQLLFAPSNIDHPPQLS